MRVRTKAVKNPKPTPSGESARRYLGRGDVLDRAVAHRSGPAISGPPTRAIFAHVPRSNLLEAMYKSMAWHRAHEEATLYPVLNACRAWRFAAVDMLGSKLEGGPGSCPLARYWLDRRLSGWDSRSPAQTPTPRWPLPWPTFWSCGIGPDQGNWVLS